MCVFFVPRENQWERRLFQGSPELFSPWQSCAKELWSRDWKCPLQGNCVKENAVYQETVVTETTTENYVGLASNFKERYRSHQTSLRHPSKRNETELSKYIWDLKDRKKSFRVKWRILRSCQPYSNESKKCNLCLQEKYFIIFRKDLSSLNKGNEIASSYRHRNRLTLKFFRIT